MKLNAGLPCNDYACEFVWYTCLRAQMKSAERRANCPLRRVHEAPFDFPRALCIRELPSIALPATVTASLPAVDLEPQERPRAVRKVTAHFPSPHDETCAGSESDDTDVERTPTLTGHSLS